MLTTCLLRHNLTLLPATNQEPKYLLHGMRFYTSGADELFGSLIREAGDEDA